MGGAPSPQCPFRAVTEGLGSAIAGLGGVGHRFPGNLLVPAGDCAECRGGDSLERVKSQASPGTEGSLLLVQRVSGTS